MTETTRHDSGDMPVTPIAQAWCDGRYARIGNGDPLAGIIRTKHLVATVAALLSIIGTAGGLAYAQAKDEAKDAKAAVEKAEARLVKALDDKKADDIKTAESLAKKAEKQESKQEAIAAEINAVHHLIEMLVLSNEGRLPKGQPRAADFKKAAP